jgi:hypothetical protein
MGRIHDGIDVRLRTFLEDQPVFFVATAPLAGDGLVNVSPKGMSGTFRVLDDHTVAYLDLTGSGVETIAHLRENGRITLMFCAFEGKPRIVRLSGQGRVVMPDDDGFVALADGFPTIEGTRSVIVVDVTRVADSCGYAVPRMDYVGDRDQLVRWATSRGEDGLDDYRRERNAESLDGLPGLPGTGVLDSR